MNIQKTILISIILFGFAISGMLKWIPTPIDITVLFAVALVISVCFGLVSRRTPLLTKRSSIYIILLFLLFHFWYFSTSIFTVSTSFWNFKAATLLLNIMAFLAPIIVFCSKIQHEYFIRFVGYISSGTAIIVVWNYFRGGLYGMFGLTTENQELTTVLPDYLSVGVVIGIGSVLMVSSMGKKNWVVLCALHLPALLMLGGRGPFLFTIITFAIFKILLNNNTNKFIMRRFVSVLSLIIVLFILIRFWDGSDYLIGRILKVFSDEQAFHHALRVGTFEETFILIKQNFFFGVGIGGFAYASYGYDINAYPHNLFLESFVEGGIVGFILFSSSLGGLFYLGYLYRKNLIITSYFAVVLFLLLNYCKSGGFVGARDLFLFCGLMIAVLQIRNNILVTK